LILKKKKFSSIKLQRDLKKIFVFPLIFEGNQLIIQEEF